ncbi:MAG: hypothetical protein AAF622_07740, partial [Cyanobacteria bacterium P01_C01_bin.147]
MPSLRELRSNNIPPTLRPIHPATHPPCDPSTLRPIHPATHPPCDPSTLRPIHPATVLSGYFIFK